MVLIWHPMWSEDGLLLKPLLRAHIVHIICPHNSPFCNIHQASVSPDFAKQIMFILYSSSYKRSHKPDDCWVEASYIFSKSSLCPLLQKYLVYEFVRLLPVACRILLYNHINTECSRPFLILRAIFSVENFKWYWGTCFTGTATAADVYL